jgi:hypothetical protein
MYPMTKTGLRLSGGQSFPNANRSAGTAVSAVEEAILFGMEAETGPDRTTVSEGDRSAPHPDGVEESAR